jgi:large exoprotein involved in heme utilization and adhesion
VTATGQLTIEGGGEVSSSTFGLGTVGDVTVHAGAILISGFDPGDTFPSGIFAENVSGGAGGNAGSVNVTATGQLTIEGGGAVASSASGLGNGGDVTVRAGTILISGVDPSDTFPSGIFSNSLSDGAGGNAGSVNVTATGQLTIEGGGEVNSDTLGLGNGGNVTVHAGAILISGFDPGDTFPSGIGAESDSSGSGGNAGSVNVTATGQLTIDGGGEVSSSTFGLGNSGDVTVHAGAILISGVDPSDTSSSGIFATSNSTGSGGNAGSVNVTATGQLTIEGGGEVTSDTFGLGNSGDVTVHAGAILISGVDPSDTSSSEIGADSESSGSGGNAGSVNVIATGQLTIEGGGTISSSTFDTGDGGQITVSAQDLTISGVSPNGALSSGIAATSNGGTGNGGGISVQCDNLKIDSGGEVSASAQYANAGNISIGVASNATLQDNGSISSSAGIAGGSITVEAGNLLYLLDSSITATAGALRDGSARSNGNFGSGGNITLDPEFIVLNDSLISANAAAGQGGNILLESSYYLNSGSTITATGATSGTVTITSPELDLSGALVGLPASLIGAETQLQETCAMALNGDFSSFLAVGQGDIEAAPDEAQGGSGDAGDRHRERPVHRKPGRKTGSEF